jgi:transcriptional regulator with XRE-family HTH domain
MTLGQKITNLRKARGMTQEELSEAVGVTRQTISKWELDASTPDLDYLCKLCDLFGVTADDLIRPGRETVEATKAATTPTTAPTPVSHPEQAPQSPSRQITGLRFTGWVLFIFGLVLTQVALLFILFDSDSTVLWISAGVLIIIGLELLLIRRKPLFIVMWTAWSMLTTVISFTTGSPFWFITALSPTFIEGGAVRLSFTMVFSILWIIYTAFCIGATVGVIRKHIRAKRAKR